MTLLNRYTERCQIIKRNGQLCGGISRTVSQIPSWRARTEEAVQGGLAGV
jgi:hypothetical protein